MELAEGEGRRKGGRLCRQHVRPLKRPIKIEGLQVGQRRNAAEHLARRVHPRIRTMKVEGPQVRQRRNAAEHLARGNNLDHRRDAKILHGALRGTQHAHGAAARLLEMQARQARQRGHGSPDVRLREQQHLCGGERQRTQLAGIPDERRQRAQQLPPAARVPAVGLVLDRAVPDVEPPHGARAAGRVREHVRAEGCGLGRPRERHVGVGTGERDGAQRARGRG